MMMTRFTSRPRARPVNRILLRTIAVGGVAYAVLCVFVATAYRAFLYPAPKREEAITSDAKKIEARTSDGKIARAFRIGDDHPEQTIVFFHGNGELASDGIDLAHALASHGWAVVLAEYRGYGSARDAGPPTENGLYADAEAILAEVGGAPVLMGFSLGTGVATEMAARGHGRALILLAPYTSIPDVAQRHVPIFPMRLLMRDNFDTRSKAPAISIPVFVAHGDADEVVPFDMGETVAHAFPHGRFVAVSGAHHTDMFGKDDHLLEKIVDFIIDVSPL